MNNFRKNIERSARYALLAGLLRKKHDTIKKYFNRHGLDVWSNADVEAYLELVSFKIPYARERTHD